MAKLTKESLFSFLSGNKNDTGLDFTLMQSRIQTINELKSEGFTETQAMRVERCLMLAVESSRAANTMRFILVIVSPLVLCGLLGVIEAYSSLFGGTIN